MAGSAPAMLLFLLLALLAGPDCTAQEIQGIGGGNYFYIKGEKQGEIKAIRVFMGITGLITAIQLRFGNHWSSRYGAPGGQPQLFQLGEGEYVTAVKGSGGICLRQLTWITNKGRLATFGQAMGRRFSVHAPVPGQRLRSVNGQHKMFCLSGIGFKWGYAPEGPSTGESTDELAAEPTQRPANAGVTEVLEVEAFF